MHSITYPTFIDFHILTSGFPNKKSPSNVATPGTSLIPRC
jgi:hypothetical protein